MQGYRSGVDRRLVHDHHQPSRDVVSPDDSHVIKSGSEEREVEIQLQRPWGGCVASSGEYLAAQGIEHFETHPAGASDIETKRTASDNGIRKYLQPRKRR